MSEWISVDDRLPEASIDLVDVFVKPPVVGFAMFCSRVTNCHYSKTSKEWYIHTANGTQTVPFVTHWMPLPEPPK